jgi:Na+-translocating ferredoxin:NAD+ oxidoreductase RnfD subunit
MADTRSALRRYVRTPKGQFTLIMAFLTILAATHSGWRLVGPGLLGAVLGAMLVDAPLLRRREHRWTFPDGAMLTGWIVACVQSPHEPWYVATITAIVGVLSKYVWRSGRANVLNPAAFALVATFYIFHTGQSWWGALPELSLGWILVLLGSGMFMVLRLNKLPLLLAFLGVFFLCATIAAFVGDPSAVAELYRAPDLHATLYFGCFMLTDPPTSPPKHREQLTYGVIVALVGYAVFHFIGAAYFLLAGLLVANIWEGWRKRR